MTGTFTAAGLRILVFSEPAAAPDTPRELLPDAFGGGADLILLVDGLELAGGCGQVCGAEDA